MEDDVPSIDRGSTRRNEDHHPPPPLSRRGRRGARVVVHLDVDAFYVACERELRPELRDRPAAVCQYNPRGDLSPRGPRDPARLLRDGSSNDATNARLDDAGALIAVSYEARARGVRRSDRSGDALRLCPELALVRVPVRHGKADLTMYRDASDRVVRALTEFFESAAAECFRELLSSSSSSKNETSPPRSSRRVVVEKASVDEIYVDATAPVRSLLELCRREDRWAALRSLLTADDTPSRTCVGGRGPISATDRLDKDDVRRGSAAQTTTMNEHGDADDASAWWNRALPWDDDETSLAVGALLASRVRRFVTRAFDGSVFTLSAGVSRNKLLAKLASGLRKPDQQTIVDPDDDGALASLFRSLPLTRLRGLGGALGRTVVERCGATTVGELSRLSLVELRRTFDDDVAVSLYRVARGVDDEPVVPRTETARIGASRTFRGASAWDPSDEASLRRWLGALTDEIVERLERDPTRRPRALATRLDFSDGRSASTSTPFPRDVGRALDAALACAKTIARRRDDRARGVRVVGASVAAANFVRVARGADSIAHALRRGAAADAESTTEARPRDAVASDPDLEYAKKLQATFDREHEVMSMVEARSSTKRKRRGASGVAPIDSYFRTKKSSSPSSPSSPST